MEFGYGDGKFTMANDYFWDKEIIGDQMFDFTCPSLGVATTGDLDSISDFNFSAADSTTELYSEQQLPQSFLHRQDTLDTNPDESKLPPQNPSVIDTTKGCNSSTIPSLRETGSTPENNAYPRKQLAEWVARTPPKDSYSNLGGL
jgi:hypothetical protein